MNDGIIFGLLMLVFIGFFYFLPSLIATYRDHKNLTSIFVLNLLLGWTFLGWVVAVIWSFSAKEAANSKLKRTTRDTQKQALNQGQMKLCPFCAEEVKVQAILCKHCGSDLKTS